MLRKCFVVLGVVFLAAELHAQTCGAGQTFLKNDNLPANPGSATVSVIQGLCEGEAAGCVFDVSSMGSTVKVDSAAIGYVNVAGASGIQAVVNLEIYDGVTFVGNVATLGPQVLDWETLTGSSIAVTSSGINVVDTSAFNITVSSGKLVVVWQMEINALAGDCPSGYTTNFCTDYAGGPGGCSPTHKNLIYIQGQGWRDAATAMIGPFNLCPTFYAGNWLIRSCVESVGYPQTYCTSKTNSQNCVPAMTWSGTFAQSGPDDFHVKSVQVLNNKSGVFFWGFGPNAAPFGGALLCVIQPVKRTPIQTSGGNPPPNDCSGQFDYAFTNAYAAAYGVTPGQILYGQVWSRDPGHIDNTGVSLTNGLAFKLGP